MTIEETFIQAAKNKRMVELVEAEGQARIVEPYMVYVSSTGERLFHCYQLGGFSQSHGKDPIGWRNPKISDFTLARELIATYKPREGYNPENRKSFPAVIFAILNPHPLEEVPASRAEAQHA